MPFKLGLISDWNRWVRVQCIFPPNQNPMHCYKIPAQFFDFGRGLYFQDNEFLINFMNINLVFVVNQHIEL